MSWLSGNNARDFAVGYFQEFLFEKLDRNLICPIVNKIVRDNYGKK